jgi:hypothetical protein
VKRASDILVRLLDEKIDEQGRSSTGVFRRWADIVGRPLSDHSRVFELQHDQLCVEVDHPGWLQVLLLRKNQILHRVARAYPQLRIRGLRARVNLSYAASRPATEAGGPPSRSSPGAAPEAEVEQAVSGAGSEDLKARLRRLFHASLRRSSRGSSRG